MQRNTFFFFCSTENYFLCNATLAPDDRRDAPFFFFAGGHGVGVGDGRVVNVRPHESESRSGAEGDDRPHRYALLRGARWCPAVVEGAVCTGSLRPHILVLVA